ncbi:MAG TPA: cupin domain-containing protein [Novosphingobium sp.]|nr:cupin domain-containing protein [Novosphingobium sp.]
MFKRNAAFALATLGTLVTSCAYNRPVDVAASVPSQAALSSVRSFGAGRIELQRSDVPGSDYEVISTVSELEPGANVPAHTHFGIEIGYILSGSAELRIVSEPSRTYHAGDSFIVAAHKPHGAHNPGNLPARVYTTFVVEKNKPLRTLAP